MSQINQNQSSLADLLPIELLQVTICAVDTRAPALALEAIQKSMTGVRFGDAILFSDCDLPSRDRSGSIRHVHIDRIASVRQYSDFMLSGIGEYITTPFVLVVQWDGYVINPQMWSNDYLHYDYIGAVWPRYTDGHNVGNGGFSLRSKRLLDAFRQGGLPISHPEDVCICRTNRCLLEARYGIRFAPEDVANSFSTELAQLDGKTFGFHGFFRFPDVMNDGDLFKVVKELPVAMLSNEDSRKLCKALLKAPNPARLEILGFILSSIGISRKTLRSWIGVRVRFWLAGFFGRIGSSVA